MTTAPSFLAITRLDVTRQRAVLEPIARTESGVAVLGTAGASALQVACSNVCTCLNEGVVPMPVDIAARAGAVRVAVSVYARVRYTTIAAATARALLSLLEEADELLAAIAESHGEVPA